MESVRNSASSPDGILRAIIRFPKMPFLLKEAPEVLTVHLYTTDLAFQQREGIREIIYLSISTNFSTSQLKHFFSFQELLHERITMVSSKTKTPTILHSLPYLWFCKASESEEGSNRLKQHMVRKHHMLFSTVYITSRNIIGSKTAIQYIMESHGPTPPSKYLSRLSIALLLFFTLPVKGREPAVALAHTTATEGNCN